MPKKGDYVTGSCFGQFRKLGSLFIETRRDFKIRLDI